MYCAGRQFLSLAVLVDDTFHMSRYRPPRQCASSACPSSADGSANMRRALAGFEVRVAQQPAQVGKPAGRQAGSVLYGFMKFLVFRRGMLKRP
jgi:hypothetical protein